MNYYEQFIIYFEREDKENCVSYALGLVDEGKVDVITLYNNILKPALYEIAGNRQPQKISVAQEHLRTAIVRTIIECCYPYVLQARKKNEPRERVIILCPVEEYHEIGPRMVEDFFTLAGFNALYLGGNTPLFGLVEILEKNAPEYIAVSVTNYYNIFAAKKLISEIRSKLSYKPKIIIGGYAFQDRDEPTQDLGADLYLNSSEDIDRLGRGEFDEVRT
ncbi:cobalamin B12-binding domain-containing protein [Dethiobacter alkaliphilus]|uniref:cobalamin B12-binding domain-containing protein n=1 Tax=Dethiobacter alkaliphilus TaxID=427926 RepID=UPI0022261E44|nr:cobalamin-dependent protein [Dethiobacter alkaliphilus]MCW3490653.1 cobalamin-dependent protein [Dethiobacter alkaliphilus]